MSKGKYVYYFGNGKADGSARMKALLGGKGANLAEMTNLGLPVPPGFTISTEVCTYYYQHGKKYPRALNKEVESALRKMEKTVGMKFGDPQNPLLVSVRSGARASMPGMMDTILNLGLNDGTVQGLVKKTSNDRFAWDSYRRFVQMYGDVVLGLKPQHKDEIDPFEQIIDEIKRARGVHLDTELTTADLHLLVERFKQGIKDRLGIDFPSDPEEQLWGAIGAVFGSWMNPRAIAYRKLNDIPSDWGTAVSVQAMVFGNMGNDSGSGVAFTRDAATGENVFYGEYLTNAQGEDVVSGARTPLPISQLAKDNSKLYKQLDRIRRILEKHYRDMLDVEFTIQQGKLYMLQCRVGKRTGFAAIRIAVAMVEEKLITEKEALLRIEPDQLNQLLRPIFDPADKKKATDAGKLLARGLNAGPGAASGRVVFNAPDAEEWKKRGERVILTRIETSPEDIRGMNAAEGILTSRGGMTSHAALVARQMGKICVAGCGALDIDYVKREMLAGGRVIREGDYVSLDGTTGEVIEGEVQTRPSEVLQVLIYKTLSPKNAPVYRQYAKLIGWANKYRTLKIRTNADQPDQAAAAIAFGAEGIGLCRTEHMFFGEGKIGPMREMILADTVEERRKALEKLLPLQRQDFEGIFEVMDGTEMQSRAIFEAAVDVRKKGIGVEPEVMIPLVGTLKELEHQAAIVRRVADDVIQRERVKFNYLVGTMIEVPRAALVADQIAKAADFFSFGTNDLTQTTFGFSRDDAGKFIPLYMDLGILERDAFEVLDQEGVGELIRIGVERGRKTKRALKIGICGEHGGEPRVGSQVDLLLHTADDVL